MRSGCVAANSAAIAPPSTQANTAAVREPDRIHHRDHVVHLLLEGRRGRDRVRQAGAPPVEHDQPRERGHPPEVKGDRRLLPVGLDLRDPARHEHEVDGTVADDLVGDVDIGIAHVSSPGGHERVEPTGAAVASRAMDFELTDEQQLIRETARDFTDKEIVPRARERPQRALRHRAGGQDRRPGLPRRDRAARVRRRRPRLPDLRADRGGGRARRLVDAHGRSRCRPRWSARRSCAGAPRSRSSATCPSCARASGSGASG